jgi:DNA-binding transcriptional regulator YiaG
MERMTEHNCIASRVERFATYEDPFHFIDSGLPNVYLIGIKYFVCEKCGAVVAEIPAMKQLMTVIARDLVESNSSLTNDEVRFLRKRLGKKASDFAKELGITPDHLSRLENDRLSIPEPLDKLIRLVYAVSAGDSQLLNSVMQMVQSWLLTWTKRTTQKVIMKKIDDNEWSNVALAA